MSTEQNPIHVYSVPGTYTVSLTATGPHGSATETMTNYITVSKMPSTPVAGFSGSPASGDIPLTVEFTDQSVRTADMLTQATSFPVLATIPHILTDRDRKKKLSRRVIVVVGLICICVAAVLAFHFLIMD